MTKLTIAAVAGLIFVCNSVAWADLVGYWPFDEGSGSVAHDTSGQANHGPVYGATWTTGRSGSALSFDGSNDFVTLPNVDLWDFGTESFTVTAWFKSDASDTSRKYH